MKTIVERSTTAAVICLHAGSGTFAASRNQRRIIMNREIIGSAAFKLSRTLQGGRFRDDPSRQYALCVRPPAV